MIHTCPSCGRSNRIPAARLNARARCAECKNAFLPFDRPYDVPDTATFDEIVRDSPLPVIVDFWAAWCGPCRSVAPELKKLAADQTGRALVLKVDTEQLPDVAGRYRISGIPAFIRFDNGKETKRAVGAQSAASLAAALGIDGGARSAHP